MKLTEGIIGMAGFLEGALRETEYDTEIETLNTEIDKLTRKYHKRKKDLKEAKKGRDYWKGQWDRLHNHYVGLLDKRDELERALIVTNVWLGTDGEVHNFHRDELAKAGITEKQIKEYEQELRDIQASDEDRNA